MADRIHFMLLKFIHQKNTQGINMMMSAGVRESIQFFYYYYFFFVDDCCGTVKHKKKEEKYVEQQV